MRCGVVWAGHSYCCGTGASRSRLLLSLLARRSSDPHRRWLATFGLPVAPHRQIYASNLPFQSHVILIPIHTEKHFGKHILTLMHSLTIDTMTSILALTLIFTLFVTAQTFTFAPTLTRRNRTNSSPFPPDTNRGSFSLALRDKPRQMAPEEKILALEKATKAMTAFTNKYLKNTGTTLCSDKVNNSHFHSFPYIVLLRRVLTRHSHHVQSVAAVVVKGLAEHKVSLGSPLCPCRFYEGTLHIQTTRTFMLDSCVTSLMDGPSVDVRGTFFPYRQGGRSKRWLLELSLCSYERTSRMPLVRTNTYPHSIELIPQQYPNSDNHISSSFFPGHHPTL